MDKNALLSVYDKTGVVEFAKQLSELGWNLYASGGTAKAISTAGVEVKDVAELVGGGAILGHRVVTLSREIYAGLLATDSEDDEKELKKLGIPRIDLVAVDLYPLEETIDKADMSEEDVIEQTDIGGPTLLRAAAKGRRVVVSSPSQYESVISWLKDDQPDRENYLRQMAAKAEATAARYALSSARFLSRSKLSGLVDEMRLEAAYGENRWQAHAALYSADNDDPLALDKFELVGGSSPSYNNLCDIDRLLQTITHIAAAWQKNFDKVKPIAVGGKHGNSCGAAVADDSTEVLKSMLEGDLRAIFGGVVMVNFAIGEEEARILLNHKVEQGKRLLDVVVAPEVTKEARDMLGRKKGKCRVLINSALANLDSSSLDKSIRYRYVRGGRLVQTNYDFVLDLKSDDLTRRGEADERDVVLAWAVGSTSNSNTITLVKDGQLIGNGVGQQDRVGAAELGLKRAYDAGHDVHGAVAYSDSFFPFADGPLALAKAGVKAILATSGSVGDVQVEAALSDKGVSFWTMPDGVARGFYAH